MPSIKADVLVIGGGATGAGVAWDAALRGFDVVLVERGDLAEGTSGRFHGLLHSGGRYVVKDAVAAEECVVENAILRQVIPDCIEDTGGLFVTTPDDDPAYGDEFLAGCAKAKLPAEEIDVAEALRREPRLNPGIRRAFTVPDASIDAWKTVWSLARGASAHGARILTYHRVTDLHVAGGAVTGARVRNEQTGEDLDIECGFVLNASGAWAAQILHMAGIEDVGVVPGKGIMIAMNHRLVNTVVNRCTMPADGDILVPVRTVSVIGTTDIRAADPDEIPVTQEEVDAMLDDGERLVPGFRRARALRVWAGVRPLFQDARAGEVKDTRDVSRTHAVVDHLQRDDIKGLLTMSGGKLTTLRLMAQDLVDAMCEQRGEDRPCRTTEVRPPGNEDGEAYEIGSRLRRREETLQDEQLICECELIGRSRLEAAMRRRGTTNLDDLRRAMRLGMGPCQGGFCIYRATGILHGVDRLDGEEAATSLRSLPAGALEGRVPDPLRRPAAPGAAGRLDLPGAARRRAPAGRDPRRPRGPRRDGARGRRRARPGAGAGGRQAGAGDRRGAQHVSHHDAIVIGCGLAGLTAGVRLAEAGARVLVLAKGVGATHLAPGTIDVLGRHDGEPVEQPLDALGALGAEHPYARVGADGIRAAADWFTARIAGGSLAPYAYTGSVERNMVLPTAVGVPRPSGLVPETMAAGDLASDDPVVAVGFRGLKDFHPALLADMLSRAGVRARSVELELIPEGRTDVNALGYARAFDDPAFRGLVVGQLTGRRLGGDERIAFPAVLGIKDPHGVWTGLEAALGRRVFEVPDPAAVRARHARVRRAARGAAAGGRPRCGSTTSWSARSARATGCRRSASAWACARSATRRTGSCSPRAASRAAAWSSTRTGRPARSRSGSTWPGCRRRASRASRPATSTSSR